MGRDIDNWAEAAELWIDWVRAPDHDAFWAYRGAFERFVGSGNGAGLEVGAGEGRISRVLGGLGYRMTLVEPVPAFLEAARQAGSGADYVLASASDVPLADVAFDLVVLYNVLMDVDDLQGAVDEAARLLAPGGRIVIGIVHPIADLLYLQKQVEDPDDYFAPHAVDNEIQVGERSMRFLGWRRPLSAYTGALAQAGPVVTQLAEPRPAPHHPWTRKKAGKWSDRPLFLWLEARRCV